MGSNKGYGDLVTTPLSKHNLIRVLVDESDSEKSPPKLPLHYAIIAFDYTAIFPQFCERKSKNETHHQHQQFFYVV